MTTDKTEFQWSDIISLTENTYDTYLRLDRNDRDKYMKFEVSAKTSEEIKEDLKRINVDLGVHITSEFEKEKDLAMGELLLKQMKYHCGKPLKLKFVEKGPGKHIPLIDYFERNRDYLNDYDYMIIDQRQFSTLIDEDFLLFRSIEFKQSGGNYNRPLTHVGKLNNLDIFVTWYYPDKELRMDEFDVIIGRKDWVEADIITAYTGETDTGYTNKYLLKMQFPVKRGFMRIKGEMTV